MKYLKKPTLLILTAIFFSCTNNTIVTSEKIEVIIDNVTTDFSNNINAKLIPLPPQTGLSDYFVITSQDSSSNPFMISRIFLASGTTPVLPSSGTLPAPESNFLTAFGLHIDDSNSGNNLTYTITDFGLVGEQIKATITGVYYDGLNVQHTLQINIDVNRDQ